MIGVLKMPSYQNNTFDDIVYRNSTYYGTAAYLRSSVTNQANSWQPVSGENVIKSLNDCVSATVSNTRYTERIGYEDTITVTVSVGSGAMTNITNSNDWYDDAGFYVFKFKAVQKNQTNQPNFLFVHSYWAQGGNHSAHTELTFNNYDGIGVAGIKASYALTDLIFIPAITNNENTMQLSRTKIYTDTSNYCTEFDTVSEQVQLNMSDNMGIFTTIYNGYQGPAGNITSTCFYLRDGWCNAKDTSEMVKLGEVSVDVPRYVTESVHEIYYSSTKTYKLGTYEASIYSYTTVCSIQTQNIVAKAMIILTTKPKLS